MQTLNKLWLNGMKVYITGVSGGLGKALVDAFLSRDFTVVGIGRTNVITHVHYSFLQCDLSDVSALNNFKFETEGEECILINNAGTIGSIERISEQHESDILDVMTVNATAPMQLCQKFLREIPFQCKATIVNISSGASSRSIPSWAAYCASKAAIDRFSETLYFEEKERNRNVRVYAIAPGVIDTPMQDKIRSSKQNTFSSAETFRLLYQNKELQSAESVADKIVKLLDLPWSDQVIFSLKGISV